MGLLGGVAEAGRGQCQGQGSRYAPPPGFPAPKLTLSQPEVSEGTLVSVECEAHSPAVVTLHGAPASRPSERHQIRLNASAEDNERIFSCLATLKVAGQMVHKNQTRELRVLCAWDPWTMTPSLQGPTPKPS